MSFVLSRYTFAATGLVVKYRINLCLPVCLSVCLSVSLSLYLSGAGFSVKTIFSRYIYIYENEAAPDRHVQHSPHLLTSCLEY